MAYSADSMALFGDIYLRDDGQLHWKAGMLEFNFQLTEVRRFQQVGQAATPVGFSSVWRPVHAVALVPASGRRQPH